MVPWVPVLLAIVAVQPPVRPARAAEPAHPACLTLLETRQAVQDSKMVAPFRAVAEAMRDGGGDLVGIRLCRPDGQQLLYDVMVLRHDGRLVHVFVDAGTGALQAGRRQP